MRLMRWSLCCLDAGVPDGACAYPAYGCGEVGRKRRFVSPSGNVAWNTYFALVNNCQVISVSSAVSSLLPLNALSFSTGNKVTVKLICLPAGTALFSTATITSLL
ncbi:hypothetical protein D3C73_1372080 [compost metagenome]